MSRFPKTEAEIAALAALVVEGFAKAPEYFPNPPVPTTDLKTKLDAYQEAAAACDLRRARSGGRSGFRNRIW